MRAVYRFHWNCGRMGNLDGVFVAEDTDVAKLIGKHADFGECLGKHSEVSGTINPEDIRLISSDPAVVAVVDDHEDLTHGFSPFDGVGCAEDHK